MNARIRPTSEVIAHIGYPTHTFKSPSIYNPFFVQRGIDCVAVPMGVKAESFATFLPAIFSLTNIRGAVITMPHKMAVLSLLDEVRPAARIAGACNAVRKDDAGRLVGDLFDGEGFVRGARRKGCRLEGARVLVVGSGGVGSAISASLAASGIAALVLHDVDAGKSEGLAARLRAHYPALDVRVGDRDPAGYDVVVNATPLGMNDADPMPMNVERIAPSTFVGEVVLRDMTPFLRAVASRGCRFQLGTDMLFEQFPAYLEFFGFPTATPDELRAISAAAG